MTKVWIAGAVARRIALGIAFAVLAMVASIGLGGSAQAQPGSVFCISFPSDPLCLVVAPAAGASASSSLINVMYDVNSANNVLRSNVGSQIQSIRDEIRCVIRRRFNTAEVIEPKTCRLGAGAIGFAPESDPYGMGYDPFEALGYAKSGMVTKARPMAAPAAPSWFVSVWGQGSADYEDRDLSFAGAAAPSTTRSYSGLGGLDVVKIGIATNSDALVIGVLGIDTSTRTSTPGDFTRSTTPGGGMYVAYIAGGFSVDYSFLANFTSTTGTAAGVAFAERETDSYISTANIQYKFDLPNDWWIEPTGGFSHTRMYVNIPGFVPGHVMRFQGGVRGGTEWIVGKIRIQPTIMGVAYEDVTVVNPRLLTTAFFGPTDQGYLWGKGTGKLNVQWTDKFSTFVEGEVRGRADVIGYAGRVSARYTF